MKTRLNRGALRRALDALAAPAAMITVAISVAKVQGVSS